jgi:hypothetical protein
MSTVPSMGSVPFPRPRRHVRPVPDEPGRGAVMSGASRDAVTLVLPAGSCAEQR